MDRRKYVDSIIALEVLENQTGFRKFLETVFSTKKRLLSLIETYETSGGNEGYGEWIDSIRDKKQKDIKQFDENGGVGIFKIDMGNASQEYVDILKYNDSSIPIQAGDSIVGLHIEAVTEFNDGGKTTKELFRDGFLWLQNKLRFSKPQPTYITFFSHLSDGTVSRYPEIFTRYHIKETMKERTSVHRFVFGEQAIHTEAGLQGFIKELEYASGERKAWLEKRIAMDKQFMAIKKKGVSTNDISFVMCDVDAFLRITF